MTILLLESLHADAEQLLAAHASIVRASEPNAPPADLAAVQAILTRGRGRIGSELLQRCPSLRVVARAGTGLDNVDTAAAARRGIPVIYAPGANADTVAEHTMALVLDLVRGITRCAVQVQDGRWEERAHYRGNEVRGLRLGILGFGNIGRRVAALAAAFGMQVLIAAHGGRAAQPPMRTLPLDELLPQCDVLTLHAPLTAATRHCIDARTLARLPAGAFLVNTARGALIEPAALRAALQSGHLGGFAADVLEVEPPLANDPLLASDRVLLTPHVASLTATTYRAICVQTARNVLCVLRGEAPDRATVFG